MEGCQQAVLSSAMCGSGGVLQLHFRVYGLGFRVEVSEAAAAQ